jgi:hypothetical protein
MSLRKRVRITLPPCGEVTSVISGGCIRPKSHCIPDVWIALVSLKIPGEQLLFPSQPAWRLRTVDSYTLIVSDTNRVITFVLAGQRQSWIADQMPFSCPRDPVLSKCPPSEGWASPFQIECHVFYKSLKFYKPLTPPNRTESLRIQLYYTGMD